MRGLSPPPALLQSDRPKALHKLQLPAQRTPLIPLATICTFLAGGALLWPTVLHVRF